MLPVARVTERIMQSLLDLMSSAVFGCVLMNAFIGVFAIGYTANIESPSVNYQKVLEHFLDLFPVHIYPVPLVSNLYHFVVQVVYRIGVALIVQEGDIVRPVNGVNELL